MAMTIVQILVLFSTVSVSAEDTSKFVKLGAIQNSASTWAIIINMDTHQVTQQLENVDHLITSVQFHLQGTKKSSLDDTKTRPDWMSVLQQRIETTLTQFLKESRLLSNKTENFLDILSHKTAMRRKRAVQNGSHTESPWTLFNIAPYHELENLANEVNKLELDEILLNDTLAKQRLLLDDVYKIAENNYAHLQTLPWDDPLHSSHKRQERSLLPSIGVSLNKVFGVATQGQIDDVSNSLKLLEQSEQQLQIIQSKALIALNATHVRTQINEQNIQLLSDRVLEFKKLISKMELRYKVFNEQTNNALAQIIQVEQFISELSGKLEAINVQINELIVAFQAVLAGELSPSLLAPDQFLEALQKIERALPEDVALIRKPIGNLYYYYKNTPVFVWPRNNSFVIIAMVNLKSFRSEFNIFEFIGLPVIMPNSSMYIQISSASPFLAISKDELTWYIPKESDIQPCLGNPELVCASQEPQFSIDVLTHCLIALYVNDHDAITKLCKRNIRYADPTVPLITSLGDGHWIVSPFNSFRLTIQCLSSIPGSIPSQRLVVTKPLEIRLSKGCRAYSSTFALPRFFQKSISVVSRSVTWRNINVTLPSYVFHGLNLTPLETNDRNSLDTPLRLNQLPVDAIGQTLTQVKTNLDFNQKLLTLSKTSINNIKARNATNWHQYGIVVLAIFMFIIIMILWYQCGKSSCCKRKCESLNFRGLLAHRESNYAQVNLPLQQLRPPSAPLYPELPPNSVNKGSTTFMKSVSTGMQVEMCESENV